MKEFKLRFTADVADIEAQFKGAASELKKFAAGVASAENQLEALQQTGAYLAQMDKQLAELKKKYPDTFNKIFGNVDAQMKAALEPLAKSSTEVGKTVKKIGDQLSGIASGKVEATNTEMKKLGETVAALAKTMGMQADLDFLNGTDKARLKAQKLIDVLSNLAVAYYKLDKASDKTDLGSLSSKGSEQEKPTKKPKRTKKTLAVKDSQPEDSNSAPVVEHLKNVNNELENQINELEQQKIRYQEIIDIITGENPDIRLKTTKKTDEQQLKDLVQQFHEATIAVKEFEAANNTSSDGYKKALGEQYRLATLVKNTMDYVSESGSSKGEKYVLSQVNSGVYEQAEKIIDGLKTSVATSIHQVVQNEIDYIDDGINKLKEAAKQQTGDSSATSPNVEVKAAQDAAEAARLKAEENEKARLAAEAEAKAAQEAAEASRIQAEEKENTRLAAEAETRKTQETGDLESNIEKEKQLTQELTALREKLNSIPTNPVDIAELETAQKEVKSLQEEILRLEGALDSWKSGYYDIQKALDGSVSMSEVENMTSNDVVDEYREKVKLLSNEVVNLNNKLIEAQAKLGQPSDSIFVGADNSAEIKTYEDLKQKIIEVTTEINAKTEAFKIEGTTVDSVVSNEILSLDKLIEKLKEVLNNIQNINNTSLDINIEKVKNEIDALFAKLTDSSYKNEYLGLLNSKTGKVSSEYFEGNGNRAEGIFKNKEDYDTMFHNHPDVSTAIPSIADWKTFLSEFDNFRKQIILTKDEITTFDLSKLTRQELKELVDVIESELTAAKYDKVWVKDTEKYGKDEATQRWAKRNTVGILARYPNVQMSTQPVINNTTEPSTTNIDSKVIQSEIDVLSLLENKIFDVKHAVEEKIKAFVNEGKAVDSNVTKEIASLDNLLNKINEIKNAVDSKTTAFKKEGNAVFDSAKQAAKQKEKSTNGKKQEEVSARSENEQKINAETKAQEAFKQKVIETTSVVSEYIDKLKTANKTQEESASSNKMQEFYNQYEDSLSPSAIKQKTELNIKNALKQIGGLSNPNPSIGITGKISEFSGSDTFERDYAKLEAYKEMLEKIGYILSEPVFNKQDGILSAKIVPIDGKAITDLEQARKILEDIYINGNSMENPVLPDYIQKALPKLQELKEKLSSVTNQDELKAWKQEWDEVVKSISQAKKEQEGLALNNQKVKLSGIKNGLTSAYKGAAIDINNATDEQKEFVRSYESLISKLDYYAKNRKLLSSEEIADLEKEANGIRLKAEAYKTQIEAKKKSEKSSNEDNKRLSSYGKATYTSATKKYDNINNVINNSDFVSDGLLSAMDEYKKKYDALTAARQRFIDNPALAKEEAEQNAFRKAAIETDKAREKVSLYIEDIKKFNEVMNSGALKEEPITYNKDIDSVADAIKKYADNLFEGKLQVTGWNAAGTEMYGTLNKGKGVIENVTIALNRGTNQLYAYGKGTKEVGSAWQQFTGGIVKKSKEVLTYLTGGASIYKVLSEVRRGIQYVKEIDSALTELKKVTDETDASYAKFLQTMSKTGAEIGATVANLTNMAANWARLGYSMEEAGNLARSTAVLLNVSEFTDAEKASEALISTIQAYGYAAEDSMHVVDVLNEIGNNFAISSDGIATALQDSASALMSAGNNLEQSVAMVAAANKVLQDPSQVGGALRTISLRIRGTSVEVLEEMGEETDGVVESASKLQAKLKGLTGVNILNDAGGYKDTYTIIKEIAEVWPEINDMNKAATLELLAGKNRSNAMAAMLTNLDDLTAAYEDALDAEGSAMAENEKYLDSIQGRIDQFTNSVQTMWMNALDSDIIKGFVNVGTSLINIFDQINNNNPIGVFGGLAVVGGTLFAAWKGIPALWTAIAGATKGKIAEIVGETAAIKALNAQQVISNIAQADSISNDIKEAATSAIITGAKGKEKIATNLVTIEKIKEALAAKGVTGANADAVIAAMGLTNANAGLATSFSLVTKSILKFLATNPVGWAIIAAGAFATVTAINKKLKQAEEEVAQAALESGNSIKESNKSLDEYKNKVLELRKSLDKGNLSEAEAYETRKQLISIQDELISKYGQEADGINLVTGSIEDQIDAIDRLAVANANDWLNKNSQQPGWFIFKGDSPIDQAIEAIEGTQDTYLNLGTNIFNKVFKDAYDSDKWKAESKKAALEYQRFVESLGGTLELDSNTIRFTNVTKEQIKDNYDKITNWLRDYAAKTGGKIDFQDMIGKISEGKEELLGDNFETQKANYDAYLENTAIASYTDAYGAILDEKEKFQKAYASGDKEAIREARKSLEEAIDVAQNEAGNDTRMANWFGDLAGSFENAFKDIDFEDAWENTGTSLKSTIEEALKDIGVDTDAEILNIGSFIDENGKLKDGIDGITQEQVDAYNILKNKASEYGFSVEEIVAKLAKLGLIKSNLTETSDVVESVGKSFTNYASTIETLTDAQSISNELIYDNMELTKEQGEALGALVGSEAEYAEAVDTSNGYVVKNAKLVKDLIAKKKIEAAQNVKTEKTQARLKYYDLYKQIKKLSGANGELAAKNKDQINTLYAEMGIVQQTISKYSMLEQKLLGAADAYDKFEEAQTADSESDYSSKMTDMLTGLINGLQTGKIGTEAFKTAVKGLIPDEELNKLDTVKDKVKAIADYITTSNFKDYFNFEFDDDGTLKDITMNLDNVKAFVEDGFENGALTQTGEDWTQFELSDQIKTLDDLAKSYGITKEAAFAYLQLINQYDGEWLIGDFATTFDSLVPTAATIKEAGEQMQKAFDQANVDLTLRPKVSWEKMNEAGWDTEEGSYSTVNTVTYLASDFGLADKGSSEDYAINVTPILPDGTVIKGGEDGLWEYINGKKKNGENIEDLDVFLGKYSSLEEAEEAAQVLHEVQEAYFGMVNNYSIDNDISETTRKISELDVQLANGKITQEEYMAKMYGIGDAATKTQQATGGLKGNLDALGDAARDNISAWKDASDGYTKAKEKVTELEEKIKDANEDELPGLQEELAKATSKMVDFGKEMSAHEYTELTIQFAIDDVQKDIDEIDQKYSELAKHVTLDNESGTYKIDTGIAWEGETPDQATIDNYLKLLDEKHTLEVMQGEEVPTVLDVLTEINDVLNTITTILAKKYGIDIETGESTNNLQTIIDKLSEVKPKQVLVEVLGSISDNLKTWWARLTGSHELNGTANDKPQRNTSNSRQNIMLQGTAHSSGDWGLQQNEHNALVGEIGQELVVNPKTGKYYTVGDNGAELVDLPKDAIIFNHRQTEELFKNGHINSRGRAYAQGNAHVTVVPDFTTKNNYSGAGSYWSDFAKSIDAISDSVDDASSDSKDDFEELFDWFEVLVNELDQSIDLITAKIDNTVGASGKNALYQQVVDLNYAKMAALNKGIELYSGKAQEFLNQIPQAYKEMAQNGAVALTDFQGEANEKVVEAIKNYREWKDKAADLNVELENIKKNISDINVQMLEAIETEYENKIGLITNLNDRIQKAMDLQEESGERLSANYYNEMIKNAQEALKLQRQQRKEMQAQLDQSVANGDVERYSEDWYNMVNAINDVDEAIVQSEIDIESFQNAINDLHWENFERLIKFIENVSDEAEHLRNLIKDDDITDDVGNWTEAGITALGLVSQEMENAKYRAELYGKEIEQLKKDYKAGLYSQDEYNDKLQELKSSQWDCIDAYESAKDAIVDLNKTRIEAVKDGIQKEIDAYEKFIDKRKEDLDAQKDQHDWAKTVKEHTSEIDSIQRQIDALNGDTSASAAAQRKKLQEELANAQQELEETYYDREIEMQQKALDETLELYKEDKEKKMEELDEYLKHEEQVIADSYELVLSNSEVVYTKLNEMAKEYNIEILNSVVDPWNQGTTALGTYGDSLELATSGYVAQLKLIEDELTNIQNQADATARSLIAMANAQSSQIISSGTSSKPSSSGKTTTPASKPSSTTSGKPSVGQTVTVKTSATNWSRDGGNGTRIASFVKGSSYTVKQVSGNEVLIGTSNGYTGWINKKDLVGYASGTTGVKKSGPAVIDENGLEEIVMHTKGGKVAYLTKGTSVLPHDISENLMKLGSIDYRALLDRNKPKVGAPYVVNNDIELNLNVGEVIHVEHMDNDSLPEIQDAIQKQLDSYIKRMNNGVRKYAR